MKIYREITDVSVVTLTNDAPGRHRKADADYNMSCLSTTK